jgi:hypothetical protein
MKSGVGPLAFGALVEAASYPVAWLAAAVATVVAGVLMAVGRALLVRRRDRAAIVRADHCVPSLSN